MKSETENKIADEARTISYYLIGEYPGEQEINLYSEANQKLEIVLEPRFEGRLWEVMLKHRNMFGVFDAGLALVSPESLIRQKILVMLAILETSPQYCHNFLSVPFKKTHLIFIGQRAFVSVLKSILGFMIVKTYSILWR